MRLKVKTLHSGLILLGMLAAACGNHSEGTDSTISSASSASASANAKPTVGKPFTDKMCQSKDYKPFYSQGLASAKGIAKADAKQAKVDGAAAGKANAESAALLLTVEQGTQDGSKEGEKAGYDVAYEDAERLSAAGTAITVHDQRERAGYEAFRDSPASMQKALEEGRAEGKLEAQNEARDEGAKEGKEKGAEKGLEEGKEEGERLGEIDGEAEGELWSRLMCASQAHEEIGLALTATNSKTPKVPLPAGIVCPEIGTLNGLASNALFIAVSTGQSYCVQLACSKVSSPQKKTYEAAYTPAYDKSFKAARRLNVDYWSAYKVSYDMAYKQGQVVGTKEGRAEGVKKGTEAVFEKAFEEGAERGVKEAEAKGHAAGLSEGRNDQNAKAAAHDEAFTAAFTKARNEAFIVGENMTRQTAANNATLIASMHPCE